MKKLYTSAFITSPIIALYGAFPFLIFEKVKLGEWLKLVGMITVEVAVVWFVHIYFELRLPNQKNSWRFVCTYFVSTFFRLPTLLFLDYFKNFVPQLAEKYLAYPIVTSFAVNVMVMVIVQSIVNGYKKAESEKQLEQLRWQNTETQKQVLMQQLQPHFLFNSLSTLKSLITENPALAEEYTLRLSDFLRYSVQSSNCELATLEKELQFVSDYIGLQQIRFGSSFTCEIGVSDGAKKMKIPVLALQILVENIFKHNYFTEKKPLHFSIRTNGRSLVVHNQKTSVRLSERNNTGLGNLNTRYQLIGNKTIEVVDTEHEFIVTLPLL